MIPSLRFFRSSLLSWNAGNTREMPWKGEKDPYRVWLSEIILQQTRVEQGLPYYERFTRAYPDIASLAAAKDEEVFRHWQGLGYYARCRNMLLTAREIVARHGGRFPSTYVGMLELKGIGSYTAAAIASFAFGLPHAVLDGNVFRVLARFFGIAIPAGSGKGKAHFSALAEKLLDRRQPGVYNQAIMDFGSLVCKPRKPLCLQCPLSACCVALKEGAVESLPVKAKKTGVRKRYFNYLVIGYRNRWYIRQRQEKDIWRHLYEFPLIESKGPVSPRKLEESPAFRALLAEGDYLICGSSGTRRQQLTHQHVFARFLMVRVKKALPSPSGYLAVKEEDLKHYAFPKLIVSWLQENTLSLTTRC